MRYSITLVLVLASFFTTTQADSQTLWQLTNSARSSDPSPAEQFYRLDQAQLHLLLSQAPLEGPSSTVASEIFLPVANGDIERFSLEESPIMQSGLAARYPEIKTYKVYGIDDPRASGRLSISSAGLHGMITSPTGSFFIDPQGNDEYHAYRKSKLDDSHSFNCGVVGHNHQTPAGIALNQKLAQRTAGNLRVYRTAIAATEEFVDDSASGGTKSGAMATVTNIINRINQIYERDLGVRLQLVNNTDDLFFESGDSFTNGNAFTMLGENQSVVDSAIGTANYDIAHVFGTGGGGVAALGAVCSASRKAQGVSNGFSFTTDSFAIDLAAHEIGHQFSADHSFNGTTSSCGGGNRSSTENYEPGSGSTIMSYAGICGSENVQFSSDAMFHAKSIEVIDTFTTSGGGSSCGSLLAISNPNEPTADAGNNYTIPVSTPFVLTADGSDADGDTLSYTWDQIDAGTATNSGNFGTDLGDNVLMRSYLPRSTKSRFFPQLETVLDGGSDTAEVLPATDRTVNIRVTVRDGKSGMATDDVVLTAENTAGPFTVTSHDSSASLSGGDSQTVTWNVANTDQAPISCSNVDIDLFMLDNAKNNYCVESLADSTSNDGSATITLPDLTVPKARIRISCSDNVFYALSSADLEITGASAANTTCNSVESESEEHENVTGTGGGTGTGTGTGGGTGTGSGSGSSGGGSGVFGLLWLIGLHLIAILVSRKRQNLKTIANSKIV